jgi:hypothetical protein
MLLKTILNHVAPQKRSISVAFGAPDLPGTESIAGAESSRVSIVGMTKISLGNAQGAVTGREPSGLRPLVAARPRLHSNRCHPRPLLRGENEPTILDISDCCETGSAVVAQWSQTRSEAGPRRVQATTQEGRHQGSHRSRLDLGGAPHFRPRVREENEPIFLDISDCCETSSALGAQWSRTRSEAGPRRVLATTHAGRHTRRDRSRQDRGLASLVRSDIGGENEAIFYDISDCCETRSAGAGRWSRTRSRVCPRRVQAALHPARRHQGPRTSDLLGGRGRTTVRARVQQLGQRSAGFAETSRRIWFTGSLGSGTRSRELARGPGRRRVGARHDVWTLPLQLSCPNTLRE